MDDEDEYMAEGFMRCGFCGWVVVCLTACESIDQAERCDGMRQRQEANEADKEAGDG